MPIFQISVKVKKIKIKSITVRHRKLRKGQIRKNKIIQTIKKRIFLKHGKCKVKFML